MRMNRAGRRGVALSENFTVDLNAVNGVKWRFGVWSLIQCQKILHWLPANLLVIHWVDLTDMLQICRFTKIQRA
jgi:hypothetical protein